MRWGVFLLAALLFVALERSVRAALTLHSFGGISPSFTVILLVYLALLARRSDALWAALLLGVLQDLSTPIAIAGNEPLILLGPYALGYVFAAFIILQLRTMVFRKHMLTIAILTLLAVVASSVMVLAYDTIRGWYPQHAADFRVAPSAGRAFLHYLAAGVYASLLALPLGWILLQTTPLWGFVQPMARYGPAKRS